MINILIADDDNLMRAAVKKIISQWPNYQIYEAHNGCEAVALVREETIDIAFIDLRMPRQGGIETIRNIREMDQNMTIVIMSSYHNADLAYLAIQYKVAKCLMKPIAVRQIEEVIKGYETLNQKASDVIYRSDEAANRVESLIKKGQFDEAYGALEELISKLLQDVSIDSRVSIINELMVSVLGTLFPNLMQVYDEMMTEHELTSIIVADDRLLKVWTFKIVDYIFQRLHGQQNDILRSVMEYIDQNIYSDISLKDIVQGCNVSQGHVSRIFKTNFTMTVMQYIHNKKLNIAKEYMCMTTLHGAEIAVKLGYNDFSYFCKIFKKYEDTTISQYRGYGNG